jgi:DNA-binding winged helix-turn-helix (wHTH) protein
MVVFPPYKLDLGEERLWKGAKLLSLRRKPFAILRYLVENPRRLVTHDELLQHVWSGAVVSESAVRTHLHELRQVLGEGVIETVIGRGYRFTAELAVDAPSVTRPVAEPTAAPSQVVGRDAELAVLRGSLDRVVAGHRQVCFVTGDPGIGKTTLVDAFVAELEERPDVITLRGHCVEQHGTPEAYFPIIEMVSALRPTGGGVIAALVRHAPTFLAQVPHLIPEAQVDDILRRSRGGTEARMVRELMEALESLCVQHPLVVVLEDLQWSDVATIDLLALLGQRRERAQLMVIATARRAEVQTVSHPLNLVMRSLIARSGAVAIPVDGIGLPDVARFIELRFPRNGFPPGLAAAIDRITGGTPLFMVSVLEDLVGRKMIEERDGRWELAVTLAELSAHRADSVKQLIDIQLDRLSAEEQRVLEAASVIGAVFPTELVAAALEGSAEAIDDLCDGLARRGLFLRREGSEEWPDGTLQPRYGMTHGVVLQVCVERSAPARRQRWHRSIAERLDAAYGERAAEVSHVLAWHYAEGGVADRAVQYYVLAAERTALRYASNDALRLFTSALELLRRTPETRARDELELRICLGMAPSVLRLRSELARDPLALFERMVTLAQRLDHTPRTYEVLINLSVRHSTLANYHRSREICDQLDAIARTTTLDPDLTSFGGAARLLTLLWGGELVPARTLLHDLIARFPVGQRISIGILGLPEDRTTILISYLAAVCWLLGEPDQALAQANRAVAAAQRMGDPYAIGHTFVTLARIHLFRRDPVAPIRAAAEASLAIPDARVWHPQAALLVAWARAGEEPMPPAAAAELVRDVRDRAARLPMGTTFVALPVIDLLRRAGYPDQAAALVDEMLAFARDHDERMVEPELLRLRGELLEPADPVAADALYREAHAMARACAARALELRAATRLAMLWRTGVQRDAARALLAAAIAPFTEGLDTPDLVEARALLAAGDA